MVTILCSTVSSQVSHQYEVSLNFKAHNFPPHRHSNVRNCKFQCSKSIILKLWSISLHWTLLVKIGASSSLAEIHQCTAQHPISAQQKMLDFEEKMLLLGSFSGNLENPLSEKNVWFVITN